MMHMLFREERKSETNWHYTCEDIFGTVRISAYRKLEPKELDEIVMNVLRMGTSSGEIAKAGRFEFDKNSEWLDPDGENNEEEN